MTAHDIPPDLHYTDEHEWVRLSEDLARVGITDYAQNALGDVVFVTLPSVGATVTAGQACGEVESTKSVSDLFAPVSGTVVACNEALEAAPELVNAEPYGGGWMFEVRLSDPADVQLLDAAAYAERLG